MAGTGTVLADDPRLTVRDEDDLPLPYEQQPLRVVVGETPIPDYYRVLDRVAPTCWSCRRATPSAVLDAMVEREIRHVWLEGGPRLAGAFWNAGLIDRVIGYIAPAMLGSGRAALEGEATTLADLRRIDDRRPAQDRPRHPHHRHAGPHAPRRRSTDVHRTRRGEGHRHRAGAARRRGAPHHPRTRRHVRRRARRLDLGQRLLPHRRRARRRRVLGRRHGRVARPHVAGRPRARVAEVNLERAMAAGRPAWAATSCRATSTAPARLLDRTPSEHWDVLRFAPARRTWRATWSRRARSPSTECR